MRIALLSNVTVEILAGMLRNEHDCWLASGFGAWMETALDVPEDLKRFDPEVIFLLLDGSHATYDSAACAQAKNALEREFPKAVVLHLDLEDLANEVGEFYDERMWQLGAMPWSMRGLEAIKSEINRLCAMTKGGAKKVLALDLDNTLWQGVIGEDGVEGIVPRTELQRAIKVMQQRGVLLVALSKNNENDVEPVWNDSRMILKREDFVDMRINWENKAVNLSSCAEALNLGVDSFVFIDDNPAEREQMKAFCPEVVVPDWPVNIRRVARIYFPELRITKEDRAKTAQYQAETQRQALAATLGMDDYLKSLEIVNEIHLMVESEIPRVAQLSQKTNQFNVSTKRYTIADITSFAADPEQLVVTLHTKDKFGDQGLVAFVRCKIATQAHEGEIVDWAMSCRAMNRRIEFAVEEWLEDELRRRGVRKLKATWRKSAKNGPVEGLFERFGFEVVEKTETEKRYERILV